MRQLFTSLWLVALGLFLSTVAYSAPVVSRNPVIRNSMMAESPFSDYTASAVIYTIILGFLVTVLVGGGLLIVNLGLMSRRSNDHHGGREPSDVNILKDSNWPTEESYRPVLPAQPESDDAPNDDDSGVEIPKRRAS